MNMQYSFSEEESRRASDEWGCNCGPSALAFALQVSLEAVRPWIPEFEKRRYTSPTMMRAALEHFGRSFRDGRPAPSFPADANPMYPGGLCLVRVQWTGPWTAPGSNARWAYGYTHWIATWRDDRAAPMVFDVNGGVRTFDSWASVIVPLLATHPRGDGGWYPTHVWELAPAAEVMA